MKAAVVRRPAPSLATTSLRLPAGVDVGKESHLAALDGKTRKVDE